MEPKIPYLEPIVLDMEFVHQFSTLSAMNIQMILLLLTSVTHKVGFVRSPAHLNVFLVRKLKLELLFSGGK